MGLETAGDWEPSRSRNGAGQGRSVIATVFEVLRCFTADHPVQGVTEVAIQVGLHKSSVSRLLATLEELRIVERDQSSRKYRLGIGLIGIAGPLLANLDVRRLALPALQELTDVTRETSALVVWTGSESVTVEQVPSPQQVKHTTPIGTRYGTADSASVRVFLASITDARVRNLIDIGPPAGLAYSGNVDNLLNRLKSERERGFAVNYGETSRDEVGIAAPVRDHRAEVVAAVLLAAPFYRVNEDRIADLGQACVTAAAEVSGRLGTPSQRR